MITAHLKTVLESHGLSVTERGDILSVDDGRLELRAEIFDREDHAGSHTVVLELQASSDLLGGRPIVECFAGVGSSRDKAVSDAFGKMLLGSFHVIIEALTSHACDEEQAEIEHWTRSDGSWQVFSGPLLSQHSGASTLSSSYPSFISQLNSLLIKTILPGPHWIRVFLGSYHDQVQVGEVLLDNEPWEAGQSLLLSQSWSCTNEYQSIRHFVLALPNNAGGG